MAGDGQSEDFLEGYSGPACPHCGSSTVPLFSEQSLGFQCLSHHYHSVAELLDAGSGTLKEGLQALMKIWQKTLGSLAEMQERAASRGHLEVAEILARHIARIEKRIQVSRRIIRGAP